MRLNIGDDKSRDKNKVIGKDKGTKDKGIAAIPEKDADHRALLGGFLKNTLCTKDLPFKTVKCRVTSGLRRPGAETGELFPSRSRVLAVNRKNIKNLPDKTESLSKIYSDVVDRGIPGDRYLNCD
jgi:hypothetical protein